MNAMEEASASPLALSSGQEVTKLQDLLWHCSGGASTSRRFDPQSEDPAAPAPSCASSPYRKKASSFTVPNSCTWGHGRGLSKNCFLSFYNDQYMLRGGSPASRGICGDTTDPCGGFRAPYAISGMAPISSSMCVI